MTYTPGTAIDLSNKGVPVAVPALHWAVVTGPGYPATAPTFDLTTPWDQGEAWFSFGTTPDGTVPGGNEQPVALEYSHVPSLLISAGGAWSAVQPAARVAASRWQSARPQGLAVLHHWGHTTAVDILRTGVWSPVPVRDRQHAAGWQRAQPLPITGRRGKWRAAPTVDADLRVDWTRSAAHRDNHLTLVYQPHLPARDAQVAGGYCRSDEFGQYPLQGVAEYVPGHPVAFTFAGQQYVPAAEFLFTRPRASGRLSPVGIVAAGHWQPPDQRDVWHRLPWGFGRASDPPPISSRYPDYNGPIYLIDVADPPEILDTYMIANSVSLVVLPDRIPVDTTGIRVSRDIDEFAWKITADMKGRTSQALVRPTAAGPKTVELTINGHVWQFIIDRIAGKGQHASEDFTISGESRTRLLAAPYAPQRSAVNAEDINALQVCNDQLEYTGFTLNWDYMSLGPDDWTITAGAFSFQQQTPMQIIARVAAATGAVIRPALAGDALSVVPRYRAAPWAWDTEIMERIIPAEMMLSWDSDWVPNPEYNSCYVSGTSHGVAVDVRRTGTAGDQPAPDVLDDLITDTAPARWRGIAEICKGGNQEVATRVIPLMPYGSAPGLVEPAMLCEILDPDDTWRGLCLSTEITCSGPGCSRVQQTIKLERHHGNS